MKSKREVGHLKIVSQRVGNGFAPIVPCAIELGSKDCGSKDFLLFPVFIFGETIEKQMGNNNSKMASGYLYVSYFVGSG